MSSFGDMSEAVRPPSGELTPPSFKNFYTKILAIWAIVSAKLAFWLLTRVNDFQILCRPRVKEIFKFANFQFSKISIFSKMLSKKLSIFIANVLWVLGASCWHRMCGKRYRKPNFAGKKIKLFVFDFDQTVSSVHCFKQLAGWEVPSAQLKEFSSHFWRFEPILSENLLNNFIKLLLFPKLQFIGRSNVTLLRRVTVIFPNSKFRNYYCTTKFKISPKKSNFVTKKLFLSQILWVLGLWSPLSRSPSAARCTWCRASTAPGSTPSRPAAASGAPSWSRSPASSRTAAPPGPARRWAGRPG